MLISKTNIAALSLTLLGTTFVYAGVGAESGISIGIDAGGAEAHKYCQSLVNCEDSDTSVRIDVGYQFNNIWSTELGYTSFGTLFDSNDNNVNASQKANAWTLSGIATLPMSERLGLFGRAGLARYETNNSGTVQGVRVKDDTDLKPYLGAGLSFDITQSFAVRGEYQYYADISGVDGSKDDVQGLYAGVVFSF
ncbi:outer membrane beta-barrel protein [Zhongshania sp.]|jgi:opacity protein-like surface antigen|uniref:outer membrane beta-barrel protein n=1 Tax=Zhongshania sp. TaxID=1971902 RepID=UPI002A8410D2|nr:outer membrane beta-barrel protein [Zhongshania sp.]